MNFLGSVIFIFIISMGAVYASPNARIIDLEMYPNNEKSDNFPATVKLTVLEDFNDWITKASSTAEQEDFIERMVRIYSESEDVDEIETIWVESSFNELRDTLYSSPDLFDKNSNYYAAIEDSRVLGVIKYGSYEIILVEHKLSADNIRRRHYPVHVSEESRLLSNEITNDEFYQYILRKLLEQLYSRWSY